METNRTMVLLIFFFLALTTIWVSCNNERVKRNSCELPRYTKHPHIILCISDDHGWHDVSYHDNSRVQTPTLDALSADGVRLENYYVQPVCSPTRTQLMTGRYNIHDGSQHDLFRSDRPNGMVLDRDTMANRLRDVGYTTYLVGKWHLGFFKEEYLPNNRGFDHHFGFLDGGNDHYRHVHRYRMYGPFLDLRRDGAIVRNISGIHSNYLYSQEAIDVINRHNKNTPMFMYLSLQAPHFPVQAPNSYVEQYNDIDDRPRRTYAGLTTMMDEAIKNVTNALKDSGLWDDTIFVFFSDNGADTSKRGQDGGNNYPFRGGKQSLWEGGIHVPAFVTGGKNIRIKRGHISHDLFHVSDWWPTLLRRAGANVGDDHDGFDQWRVISVGKRTKRDLILHNIDPLQDKRGTPLYDDTFNTSTRAAIRVGDWKLLTGDVGDDVWMNPPERADLNFIVESNDPEDKNVWLFNIKDDPEEEIDLSEAKPGIVRRLLRKLAKFEQTAVEPIYPDRDPNANPLYNDNVWGPWL